MAAHADSRAIVTKPPEPRRAAAAGTSHSRMIALAAIATLVVAVLALPRRSALVPGAPLDDSKSEMTSSAPTTAAAASSAVRPTSRPPVESTVKPETAGHPAGESIKKPEEPAEHQVSGVPKRLVAPALVVETHDHKAELESPRADTISATTVSTPLPVPASTEIAALAQVTITGCLEAAAKDRFRLNDTEGANVPKARSWRTGFLKKHSAAVDLVGVPDVAALQTQVGKRVAVTGVQTDRELKVSSLRVVAPACE